MNAFPRSSDGRPWFDIPDDEYFAWLAVYLPDNLPELTSAQQELYNQKDSDGRLTGFWTGDLAGWHDVEAAGMLTHEFPCRLYREWGFECRPVTGWGLYELAS